MCISRQFVLQYFSEIKQKHQKLYIFSTKKNVPKKTYQVNLIYLPSKLIYLPSKFTFPREI